MALGIPVLFWDVDTAVDFMLPEGKLYVPGAQDLLPTLARLNAAARDREVPILASVDDHLLTDEEISDQPDFKRTYPPHCLTGTAGAEKVRETRFRDPLVIGHGAVDQKVLSRQLATNPREILVRKRTVDVFTNANTEALVTALQPRRIVIYGVALDVCVRWAIEGLWERGFHRLSLVLDATQPIDPALGKALLKKWRQQGVGMTTTDDLLAEC
ncbi:MAG: isochorismatase family protein [Deltaproteobacteria bacterium]|nr:isochorismatase family protein [Deltaproteobacteria bacterium]